MTLCFSKTRWVGNQWAAIDIMPVDERLFLPILTMLCQHYAIALPSITDAITGYIAEVVINGHQAILSIDTYDFSMAFADENLRDDALSYLQGIAQDVWQDAL
jgi:hypothetical protein